MSRLAGGPFAGVKIKIGGGPASDLDRVRIARRILGDDALLMVDINGNYTVDIALQSLRRIEPYDIHWCEEPLPPTDTRGYAELRLRSPIRLSAGEAHYTARWIFGRWSTRAPSTSCKPSIISGGGFGEAKAVAALAQMNNLRLSPPCWGSAVAIAAAVHFAASLPVWPHSDHVPYPMLVEYDVSENPLRDELAVNPVRLGDSGLEVPSGPGLGIDLDQAAIERHGRSGLMSERTQMSTAGDSVETVVNYVSPDVASSRRYIFPGDEVEHGHIRGAPGDCP